MVADACFLAFPFRFNTSTCLWEQKGSAEKVLFITTEQNADEIQKMILAYLTGINESKFRYGQFTELEENIIKQALVVLKTYQENFLITKMASPTNELLKNFIREKCVLEGITHVFFDYISITPSLIQEFKGLSLRNDELLLILSTTLKDIASELDVFVMSATQVNASADQNKNIRNEASLAGGRSTINKADYGFIMARPTAEELDVLEPVSAKFGVVPNVVTDVFKVRAGEWTQVRIWSYFDLGILRKEDLFMTDSRLNVVDLSNSYVFDYENWESEEYMKILDELNKGMVV
jgi:replicative DNA helicase